MNLTPATAATYGESCARFIASALAATEETRYAFALRCAVNAAISAARAARQ